MERIYNVLDDMGIKYNIDDNFALVEFWTDTAGQDIPTEFNFDGTAADFAKQFAECADNYSVDDETELFVQYRGQRGVPDTIREILEDCEEAKETLTDIADALKQAIAA